MQIPDLYLHFFKVRCQVLRHFFSESRNKYAFVFSRTRVYFKKQVVYLSLHGLDNYFRVNKSCGTNYLLNDLGGLLTLKGSGCSRNKDRLIKLVIELVKVQRTVVVCRRQTETVVNKSLFSSAVACAHGANLGQGDMAFVHYKKKIIGKVIQKCVGNTSRRTP